MDTESKLLQKLNRIEKELEKVRGVEYSLPFGSMRRARASRKWDELAKEKRQISEQLFELTVHDSVRFCEYHQHNECDCITMCGQVE